MKDPKSNRPFLRHAVHEINPQMGHTTNREYQLLQRRYDRNITGAADSPVFMQILKLLFSPRKMQGGCGKGAKICPVKAISIRVTERDGQSAVSPNAANRLPGVRRLLFGLQIRAIKMKARDKGLYARRSSRA